MINCAVFLLQMAAIDCTVRSSCTDTSLVVEVCGSFEALVIKKISPHNNGFPSVWLKLLLLDSEAATLKRDGFPLSHFIAAAVEIYDLDKIIQTPLRKALQPSSGVADLGSSSLQLMCFTGLVPVSRCLAISTLKMEFSKQLETTNRPKNSRCIREKQEQNKIYCNKQHNNDIFFAANLAYLWLDKYCSIECICFICLPVFNFFPL